MSKEPWAATSAWQQAAAVQRRLRRQVTGLQHIEQHMLLKILRGLQKEQNE